MPLGIESIDLYIENLSNDERADLRARGLLGLGHVALGMRGSSGPSVPVGDRQKVHTALKEMFAKRDNVEIVHSTKV